MAPFRKAGKTARNLAFAEAALALAKDRTGGGGSSRGSGRGKLLLAGGVAVAAGAAAYLKRDKVAGLLPSRSSGAPEPAAPPAPPQPSNYDAPGPVANTSTPVPVPEPVAPEPIDPVAEEAAAAAEAANIGGAPSDYAGPEAGEPAGEAFRPLAEGGAGEAEGQEQAEADLADNATFRDAGPSPAGSQIDATIEAAAQPFAGETPEPVVPPAVEEPAATEPAQESFLPPAAPVTPVPPAPVVPPVAEPTPPAAEEPATPGPEPVAPPTADEPPAKPSDDESSSSDDDWRTWSGRAVNP